MRTAVNGFTAWGNVRFTSSSCAAENILKNLMEGKRLKVLLEKFTGSAPKRLDTLDGLTAAQKVIRVDWFIDALKASGKVPQTLRVESKLFSVQSADHIFPVLWELVCLDISAIWETAPLFQRQPELHILIAEPLKFGPHDIAKPVESVQPFYVSPSGKSVVQPFKRSRSIHHMDPTNFLIKVINAQLKVTTDGRKLSIEELADLIDARVLCVLVNSLIPGTFTSEVLLNDRWTINLALQTASDIFQVKSLVDSGDLYENDQMGMCAFLAYFLMCGYQFCQAQAVVRIVAKLRMEQEDLQNQLKSLSEAPQATSKQKKQVESRLAKLGEELDWISSVYDCEACLSWAGHAKEVQAQVRETIARKMQERFDIIPVPRPMTINKLTESLVINLGLTGSNGLYQSDKKEALWGGRKLVLRDKETGEFYDDFSGSENTKGSIRGMLKLHPFEVVEVNPTNYPEYDLFFESTSRNKILKAGSSFLYQVFPGTTSQCQRLLLRAARTGEFSTVQKLVLFFQGDKKFVNCKDLETGNTALHLACRHGHFDIALHLLENGAHVNAQNSPGCTPLFLSTEGLHKLLSQLLLEWGANIHLKNKVSKTALELTRNADLKHFLTKKYEEYQVLSSRVQEGDVQWLEQSLRAHVSGDSPMASLKSRCIKGNTLLHMAASLGSSTAVELLLAQHVDPNILNGSGATPLHLTRDPGIIQALVEHGGGVNATDSLGNTPLHLLCADENKVDTIPDCISILVGNGVTLDIENDKGWLPVHCAASHGLTPAIEALLGCDSRGELTQGLRENSSEEGPPSLVFLALQSNHLGCATWLAEQGFSFRSGEADTLALKILKGLPQGCTQPVETFKFLLDHGADVNASYSSRNSPLHLSSALVQVPELTDLLLEGGAEVDRRNDSHTTPLFVACQANNPYAASKLIARGADYRLKDSVGRCALDYIPDYEEWMDSGHFSQELRARLKAFSLKHARDLIKSISQVVKPPSTRK